jgi:hypothetical protein
VRHGESVRNAGAPESAISNSNSNSNIYLSGRHTNNA